jgi:putative DNA primase/helicase
LFAQWVEECCDIGPNKSDTRKALFATWEAFCERNGDKAGGSKTFTQMMANAGFEPVKNTPGNHGQRGFKGVAVKPGDTTDQWQNRHDR